MRFNIDKLKAIAVPMSACEKEEMEYRDNNQDWLALSATIALRVRQILRTEKISQSDLADRMEVSTAQVSKILSGKENLGLKTLCKIESALGQRIFPTAIRSDHFPTRLQCTWIQSTPDFVSGDTASVKKEGPSAFTQFVANKYFA